MSAQLILFIATFQYRSVFLFLVFIFHCYCIKPAVCLQSLFPICTATRTTRGSTTHNMSISRYRSMSGFLSFSSKSALVWNYLPDDLKSCTTIADFRVKLAIWLKDSLTLNHCCDLLSSNVHNQQLDVAVFFCFFFLFFWFPVLGAFYSVLFVVVLLYC